MQAPITITITPTTHPRHRRIWRLEATQDLDHPPETVFPFFADAFNLERLTPSLLRFKVLTPKPIEMRSGLILNYKLRVHAIPIRWTTEIQDWDPPHKFVDTQTKGPYALWHHTHSFESIDEDTRTRCRDIVLYRPRGGPFAPLVNRFFVERDVRKIFDFRGRALEEIFPPRNAPPQPPLHAPPDHATLSK